MKVLTFPCIFLPRVAVFFEADQGDIKLVGIDKNYVVKVQLLGACKTCSINNLTLKAGIEEAVKKIAPEIKSVEPVD